MTRILKKNDSSKISLATRIAAISSALLLASGCSLLNRPSDRAAQTEAKSTLNGIFLAQQAYMAVKGEFKEFGAMDPIDAGIGFVPTGGKPKYRYLIVSDKGGWAAIAISIDKIGGKHDVWRTNSNKWTCSPFNAVMGVAANPPKSADARGASSLEVEVNECPQTGQVTDVQLTSNDMYN